MKKSQQESSDSVIASDLAEIDLRHLRAEAEDAVAMHADAVAMELVRKAYRLGYDAGRAAKDS